MGTAEDCRYNGKERIRLDKSPERGNINEYEQMEVLIIEDEKPAARRLARLLGNLGVEVSVMLHSVEESLKWFSDNPAPDLIFLDIQLSDGLSFEIFEHIEISSPIIFTTAYDEYALQAFKLNSIDYLLKPIDVAELKSAVEKYQQRSNSEKKLVVDFDDIKKFLGNPIEREYKKRFTAKVGQHLKIINADEIICFFSENKGTYAATSDKRNHLLDTTLEQLEGELSPEKFFRVNRKFFINIDFVEDIVAYSNSRLILKLNGFDSHEIIVSRERVKDFKLWLE